MKFSYVQPGMRHVVAVLTLIGCLLDVQYLFAQPALPGPEAPAEPPAAPPTEPPAAETAGEAPAAAVPRAKPSTAEPSATDETPSTSTRSPREPAPAPRVEPPPSPSSPSPPEVGAVRYQLEHIQVRGNQRTRRRVVLRYLPFKAGDLFDVDDPEIRLARYRLLGTGFFRDVQFSLKKGSERGLVVLVVDVVERNTIVLNDVWMGIAADADNDGRSRPLTAYAGIDVAETNLLGTGVTLGGAMAVAQEQLALRGLFLDPGFLGSPWMLSGTLLFNDARDFFGNAQVRYSDPGQLDGRTEHAVARYTRLGGALGIGRDLSTATQLWMHYRLEDVDADYPLQASHLRGQTREPIDFAISRGSSLLSTLRATLQLDTRDHPFLPSTGWFVSATGELGMPLLASDYSYQRSDIHASSWWQLPWHQHVLRLELFGGAISGDAPFFEQYYVGDFSDFLPSRVLGVNFDRRPPPNLLGTQVVEVRYGEFAAKLGAEYRLPLYRGHRSIFGIDFFGSAGIYSVFGEREVNAPASGYSGAARIPVDVTANVGFRMDTAAGGFVFSFSNILYFTPVSTEGPAGE